MKSSTMNDYLEPGFGTPTLQIPFRLRGEEGRALFYYTVNEDPGFWGFDLLGLPFDIGLAKGFPVFLARTDFPAAGYRGEAGWLQLLQISSHEGEIPDIALDMDERHYPVSLSFRPSLFDAPGPNPPRNHEIWEAETYLVACPDVSRSPRLFAVLGVGWGYDLVHGVVFARPLRQLSEAHWQNRLEFLRNQCPGWSFQKSFGIG